VKLDNSVALMLWSARPDMSCEAVSPAWLEFTGFAAAEALGDGWSRVVHPEDLARWLDCSLRAYDTREPFDCEYRMRRHDGEYRWVLDQATPRHAPDGLFLGYGGVCLDIHERKLAEQSLARALERERRLRTTAEDGARMKDGFIAAMLAELEAPTRAIAECASQLRAEHPQLAALATIERDARNQSDVMANLLELSCFAASGRAPMRRHDGALLSGVRVLVVEDEPPAREQLLKVLRLAGAEARAVAGSTEALAVLDAWRPDIMLSDMSLGGDDGYVLIRAVRSLPAERGGCLRAAALTERAPVRKAVAAGYDAELAKPFEPVALLATVARLVA